MDKTKLKKKIKSFAINVGLATAVCILAIFYGTIAVATGEDFESVLIIDIILMVCYITAAVSDWKEIKKLLGEPE